MNKIMLILTVIFSVSLFCRCSDRKDNEFHEEEIISTGKMFIKEGDCFPEVSDKFVYPVAYGTEEWNSIKWNRGLMTIASQLPDEVLKSISTLGLIRSFLDAPNSFYEIYYWSSNSQIGTAHRYFRLNFNSLRELLTRNDAAKSLMLFHAAVSYDCHVSFLNCWRLYMNDCYTHYNDCYEEAIRYGLEPTECVEVFNECEKTFDYCWELRESSLRLVTLEYLFTLPEILGKLSRADKKMVVKVLLANYKQVLQFEDPTKGRILAVMVWLMFDDDMLLYFDEEILDQIRNHSTLIEDSRYPDEFIAYAERFII